MDFLIANAYAEGAAPQQGGGIQLIIMMVIFFAIMYFMIIRPQQKRAKEHASLLDGLSKGDEVTTGGGLVGKIVAIGDNMIEVKIAEGTNVKVQKHAVSGLLPKGSMKEL
ncbi:MAG: Preprotein translocase subunit YajC (TC 3.A.5.1.1) [uncultured Thiotrichaceae bacterium]|uniref:Sec translocon accessory complex subunit YajC n=1 Tax=uncultured Thiotrichaceae bacterium TaxID=298394 RepID=A0A6S6SUZ9_9GAMM|nr:MAG: Preprotein translocase subunit YajC (TC 3.A.5.1.1) [uncultured Thiotrichaceae bacterium]